MIVMKVSPERKDQYIRTLMDILCYAADENNMILNDLLAAQEQIKALFKENSELRHQLQKAGLAVPEISSDKDQNPKEAASK